MIKGNYSAGSIMLDSKDLKGKKGTFYAYTYSNGVEEPLLKGIQPLRRGFHPTKFATNFVYHSVVIFKAIN